MDTHVLIIGAGVFGLSIARSLKAAGHEVLVVDAVAPGTGASGTPLGVLAPHSPDRWNEKKQAQFEALTSLAIVADQLHAETGIDIGYRRCGRLIPLTREHHPALWTARAGDAVTNWCGQAMLSVVTPQADWIDPSAAPFGAALCSLSARIDARAYCRALAASVGEGAIRSGLRLERLEPLKAAFENGEILTARQIVLATGADAFRFLPTPEGGDPPGRGEKGQAALLRLKPGADISAFPLIYSDRLYVVPQGADTVAVGATSERDFTHPTDCDAQLDTLIERAKGLCPALEDATVTERWARLRPRAADKRLLVGAHPEIAGVTVATGGFKTGLAMAHTVGRTVAEALS